MATTKKPAKRSNAKTAAKRTARPAKKAMKSSRC
jgi:hypothetical protein